MYSFPPSICVITCLPALKMAQLAYFDSPTKNSSPLGMSVAKCYHMAQATQMPAVATAYKRDYTYVLFIQICSFISTSLISERAWGEELARVNISFKFNPRELNANILEINCSTLTCILLCLLTQFDFTKHLFVRKTSC